MEPGLFSVALSATPVVRCRFSRASIALVCTLSLALTACSPKLDWRTVQLERLGYSTLFPAKPKQAERKLPYAGMELIQTLDLAQVDDAMLSVTTIEVPSEIQSQAGVLLKQLQENMLSPASIGDAKPHLEKSSYHIAGTTRIKVEVDDYSIEIKNAGGDRWMRVRWIMRPDQSGGSRIYQQTLLISAPLKATSFKDELHAEQWDPFFDEFRVQ